MDDALLTQARVLAASEHEDCTAPCSVRVRGEPEVRGRGRAKRGLTRPCRTFMRPSSTASGCAEARIASPTCWREGSPAPERDPCGASSWASSRPVKTYRDGDVRTGSRRRRANQGDDAWGVFPARTHDGVDCPGVFGKRLSTSARRFCQGARGQGGFEKQNVSARLLLPFSPPQ
jgi:hypothetical protein